VCSRCVLVVVVMVAHARQPVTRIAVLGNTGKLFSLCDGFVDLWACESLGKPTGSALVPPQAKNVVAICVDARAALAHARVAFQAKGKRLSLYEFAAGKFSLLREFALPELVRDLVWCGNSIFIAYRAQYELLDASTGGTTPLFAFGTRAEPCMRVLDDREVFLSNESLGVVVDLQGMPTRVSLALSASPLGVAFHLPYIVTLQPAGVEVHNMESGALVQTLPVPPDTLKILTQSQFALLSDGSSVLALLETPVQQQVNELLRLGRHNDAVALFEQVSNSHHVDYAERLRKVREQAARSAWLGGAFADALRLYGAAGADQRRLCALFDDQWAPAAAAAAAPDADVPLEAVLAKRKAAASLTPQVVEQQRATAARAGLAFFRAARSGVDAAQRAAVDTTLARLSVVCGELDALRELLVAPGSAVVVKDVEIWLIQRRHFAAAGIVYEATGQLRKALDLWRTIGTTSDAQFRDVTGSDGVALTQRVLKQSSDVELVLAYVDWLTKRDAQLGLAVLTAKRAAGALPHAPVLAYLRRSVDSATTTLYLEHVVNVEKVADASAHTALALAYLDTMRATAPRDLRLETLPTGLFGKSRQQLLAMLEQSTAYDAEELLGAVLGFAPAGAAVSAVSPLAEELVLLYARLKRHRDALRIIVHQLRDDARAERYCAKYDDTDQGLLRSLLAQYVTDGDANNGRTASARARRLLERYATQLSAASALDELPDTTPVAALERYLTRSLTYAAHRQRDAQIVAALSKVERSQVALERSRLHRSSVRVDRHRDCPVCRKPIADKVFARYPSGTVVHYACMVDQCVDPVTGQRFGAAGGSSSSNSSNSGKRK
jgi:hypothetical protein